MAEASVNEDGVGNVEVRTMKTDYLKIEEQLKSDKKIRIKIPALSEVVTNIVKMKNAKYDSFGEPMHFNMNGYDFYVPRGVYCEIPETVAREIENNDRVVNRGKEKAKAILRAGRDKLKELENNV
jgi:hypothetical protein